MSEIHSPNKRELPALGLSDFFLLLCSFLLSHPLYLSYLVFFSPYIFKLLSFLSPLFATTALLLLAFLTLVHGAGQARPDDNDANLSSDHLLKHTSSAPIAILRSILRAGGYENDKRQQDSDEEEAVRTIYEELEVYKIVFQVTEMPGAREASSEEEEKQRLEEIRARISVEILQKNEEEMVPEKEIWCETVTEYSSECISEKEVEEVAADDGRRGELEKKKNNKKQQPVRDRTIAAEEDLHLQRKLTVDDGAKEENRAKEDSCLGNFGSMRREKEWKRTLACKLFEERHSGGEGGGGGEAMDSLWERYEAESNKMPQADQRSRSAKAKMKKKKKVVDYEEEEEEDGGGAHLCCLQALKLSAGKMNMGMGRPGLVRISKALKGIGWLHHVGARNAKKLSSY